MSVLPRPVLVPTAAGLRWGDLVLDGFEGDYPVPFPPDYPPPPNDPPPERS